MQDWLLCLWFPMRARNTRERDSNTCRTGAGKGRAPKLRKTEPWRELLLNATLSAMKSNINQDDLLRLALRGLAAEREDLERKEAALRAQLDGRRPAAVKKTKKKSRMSLEARARIAAAQRLRWAKTKKASAAAKKAGAGKSA